MNNENVSESLRLLSLAEGNESRAERAEENSDAVPEMTREKPMGGKFHLGTCQEVSAQPRSLARTTGPSFRIPPVHYKLAAGKTGNTSAMPGRSTSVLSAAVSFAVMTPGTPSPTMRPSISTTGVR